MLNFIIKLREFAEMKAEMQGCRRKLMRASNIKKGKN